MIKRSLLILASLSCLFAFSLESLPKQPQRDDFLEAYRMALAIYGVNASYEELACLNALPFTPLRKSDTVCGRNADLPYSCEYNVQRLNNFYRLRNEERIFPPKDQFSASKRTEYRKLIADSQKEGVSAIQFAKLPGLISPCWHFVEPGTGLTIRATYQGRVFNFSGVPEKVWLLKRSSRPASEETPQIFIWENIGKLINGTTTVPFLSCGVNMLREMADNSYAVPWCPECQSPFNNCIYKHLLRWQFDASQGLKLFPWMYQLCSNEEEKALISHAEHEYRSYCELFASILNDPNWEHLQNDPARQSLLGEKIRSLTVPLMSCAECFFSLSNKRNSLSQEYFSPTKRTQQVSDKLANTMVEMNIESRYEGSLAFSLIMAAQLSGCDRPAFVVRSIAGLPARLALRTNDWHFCREINEGTDLSAALAEAAGFKVRYLTSQVSDPDAAGSDGVVKRVYDAAVRKIIDNISLKRKAVVGSNLNRSGFWGVIAGYTDNGFTWRGRTASDTRPQLSEFTTLPANIILIDKAMPKPSFEDDVSLALSRWLKFIKGSSGQGVLTGLQLWDYWMRNVSEWSLEANYPSPEKAAANRSLWNTFIDSRSDALLFVNHLIKAVPSCSIPMAEVKDILEREQTIMRSAFNNGYVLGHDGSRFLPPDYRLELLPRQLDAMRQVRELEKQLIPHLEMAQQNLRL
ncbi:hypothetical protein J6U76_05535 [bacterium]|nr:hypothetical protein [bacterium]